MEAHKEQEKYGGNLHGSRPLFVSLSFSTTQQLRLYMGNYTKGTHMVFGTQGCCHCQAGCYTLARGGGLGAEIMIFVLRKITAFDCHRDTLCWRIQNTHRVTTNSIWLLCITAEAQHQQPGLFKHISGESLFVLMPDNVPVEFSTPKDRHPKKTQILRYTISDCLH